MVAAFGQLAALHELGLLRNVRYISGISGGSWATHTFSYYQSSFPGVAQNDTQFLCLPLTAPANLTTELLAKMDPTCSRSLATKVKNQTVTGGDPISDDAIAVNWAYALKRMGIPLHGGRVGSTNLFINDEIHDIDLTNCEHVVTNLCQFDLEHLNTPQTTAMRANTRTQERGHPMTIKITKSNARAHTHTHTIDVRFLFSIRRSCANNFAAQPQPPGQGLLAAIGQHV